MKDVYAIYDGKAEGKERSRWVRIGVAFENKDGSLNVLLDAVPLSGRLQIRDRKESSDEKEA
jgi:DNA relaxase NicK